MEMEMEGEVEKGIWWGDAGDDGKGERGRGRGIRERACGKGSGDSRRAAMRVCGASVASTEQQTQAECAGGLTGGAAGRYLFLDNNDLVSLDADIFAGLTSLR